MTVDDGRKNDGRMTGVFLPMTSTHSEGDDLVKQHRRRHMEVKDEVLKQTHGMVFQLAPDSKYASGDKYSRIKH